MRWGPFKFYAACIHRAFSGWFGTIASWAGTLALLIGIALLFIELPPLLSEIAAKTEAAFFLVVFSVVFLFRVALSPYWLYREQRDAREALELARIPALVVKLSEPPVLSSVALGGATHETLNGSRSTIINQWRLDAVALVCTNEGESEAKGCRTRILSAKRISEKGCEDIGIVQSVALPWDRGDTEGSHLIDIPAAESRQIWLGSVRSNGSFWLFRDVRALPIEYQQLIGGPGLYRILLQIDGSNVPPQQLVLELKVSEGPMVQNGIQRGLLDIEILDHGVPRVGTVA